MGKLAGLSNEKRDKKIPIKAGSTHQDNKGGIFTAKIVAIWQKLFGRKNG